MRLRLIVSFALIVLVSVASMIFFVRRDTALGVREYFLHGGTSSSELAVSLESYYQGQGSWEGVSAVLDEVSGEMQGMFGRGQGQGMSAAMNQRLRVANQDGKIVADTSGLLENSSLNASELDAAVALHDNQGGVIGYLAVEGALGFQPGDELPLLNRLNTAALRAALFGGALALLLAFVLAWQLGRPLLQLTRAAQHMAGGDLNQKVKVGGGKEIESLGQAFNHMAGSLLQARTSRRAMTADIAHELRTPLAIQRAQLEAIQDGVYPLTMENLQPLVEQNQQLSRLVDDLRTLALADAGELKLDRRPIHLEQEIARIAESMHPQAESRGVKLESQSTACVDEKQPQVDAGRLEQILVNLLSNAIRHTPSGGSVRIENGCDDTHAWIKVTDSGPGIREADLPHIFERFFRTDHSRSRDEGGTGLGLAIARQLAEAHGGSLEAGTSSSGGAVFTLVLPLHA